MGSRRTTVLAALIVCLGMLLVPSDQPQATEVERPSSQVFEAAKPAVVIVQAAEAVTWSVPQPDIDQGKQSQLRERLLALVRSGSIAPTEDALKRASLQLISDDPGSWFSLTGPRYQHTDTVYLMGSGFFVTQDGYLLTNAHVIQAPAEDVKRLLVTGVTRGAAELAFVQSVREGLAQSFQTEVTEAQAQKLASWLASVYLSGLQVSSITPTYRIAFGSHSAKEVEEQGLPVEVVSRGEPIPGKDVAVLKAPGGPYTTLPLAGRAETQGARLDVVGYPCGCNGGQDDDPGRTVFVTLTRGSVQGELPMPSGWEATGTDARMQHGNSGGPALDKYGRVVGLATFQDTVERSGATRTYNFVLPVGVANEFIVKAHVRPAHGPLGRQYTQAISEFSAQHYRAALPRFQAVASVDPHNPYVAAYVDRSRQAIAAGQDRTPPPALALLLAALWLAILAGVIFADRLSRGAGAR